MPAWPGGPCPNCGEDMPANMIRCRDCRTLLNEDLQPAEVVRPEFEPLPEVATKVRPHRFLVKCPQCDDELRIGVKNVGRSVRCLECKTKFKFSLDAVEPWAFQTVCPHCQRQLQAAYKRLGQTVACGECGAKIRFVRK